MNGVCVVGEYNETLYIASRPYPGEEVWQLLKHIHTFFQAKDDVKTCGWLHFHKEI